jgi:hypothetical protein
MLMWTKYLGAAVTTLFAVSCVTSVRAAGDGSIPVEIWREGDNGMTARLTDALERQFSRLPHYRVGKSDDPNRLVIDIDQGEKGLHGMMQFHVTYRKGDTEDLKTGDFSCKRLSRCVEDIIRATPR